MKTMRIILIAGALTLAAACNPFHPFAHQNSWGQRNCVQTVSCDSLVEKACGDNDRCGDTLSCKAARKLSTAGAANICHSAWCDLGTSYRECGLFD